MANIHHVITLGIGTPADIPHFVLVGLSTDTAVVDNTLSIVTLAGSFVPSLSYSGSYAPSFSLSASYVPSYALSGSSVTSNSLSGSYVPSLTLQGSVE